MARALASWHQVLVRVLRPVRGVRCHHSSGLADLQDSDAGVFAQAGCVELDSSVRRGVRVTHRDAKIANGVRNHSEQCSVANRASRSSLNDIGIHHGGTVMQLHHERRSRSIEHANSADGEELPGGALRHTRPVVERVVRERDIRTQDRAERREARDARDGDELRPVDNGKLGRTVKLDDVARRYAYIERSRRSERRLAGQISIRPGYGNHRQSEIGDGNRFLRSRERLSGVKPKTIRQHAHDGAREVRIVAERLRQFAQGVQSCRSVLRNHLDDSAVQDRVVTSYTGDARLAAEVVKRADEAVTRSTQR